MSSRPVNQRERPPIPERLPTPVVDAHTHLNACGARDAADVTAMVDRAAAAGVTRVVTVADDLGSARWVTEAAAWDARVYAAVALHPTRTAGLTGDARGELERLAARPRVVAVGETGLDYYWTRFDPGCATPEQQQRAFRWHIDLAKRAGLPLMIHDRDAHGDVLRILAEEGPPATVIMHCFSGDEAVARRCVDAGYLLSFSGTVSFRNARELHAAARLVPGDALLVETDAPFLTPHPFRGKPNEPYCAGYTVRALAELRNVTISELAGQLDSNAVRAFGLMQTRPI